MLLLTTRVNITLKYVPVSIHSLLLVNKASLVVDSLRRISRRTGHAARRRIAGTNGTTNAGADGTTVCED
jgi:hypothetical protein